MRQNFRPKTKLGPAPFPQSSQVTIVMKPFTTILASILIVTCSLAAEEPDKRTPLERYQGDGQYSLLMCKMTLRLALARAEGSEAQDEKSDYAECIERGKATAKQNLVKALRTLKKPKAQDSLKSYHVAFVTALEGIRPGVSERKISYEQRQQALEEKLTEAWARFEIEQ